MRPYVPLDRCGKPEPLASGNPEQIKRVPSHPPLPVFAGISEEKFSTPRLNLTPRLEVVEVLKAKSNPHKRLTAKRCAVSSRKKSEIQGADYASVFLDARPALAKL
jgi:hypothetical protein